MDPLVLLLFLCVMYCFASASEVLLVKGLNHYDVEMAVLTAMLLNGYWPVQLVMYAALRNKHPTRPLTFRVVKGHIIIGAVAALVSLLRCIGLVGMPGSVYVVISCSDVIFNTMLSKLFLKKKFVSLHYVAVALTMLAIAMLGRHSVASNTEPPEPIPFWPVCSALGSALLSAVNSVLSEFVMAKDASMHPLVSVAEVSFFNSFVPFALLPIAMLLLDEQKLYADKWQMISASAVTVAVLTIALGLAISKMIDRLCKFYIIALSGAFFFALLDTFRRMATGLLAVWLFKEAFTFEKLLALFLTALGIFSYSVGSHMQKKAKMALEDKEASLLDPFAEFEHTEGASQFSLSYSFSHGKMRSPRAAGAGEDATGGGLLSDYKLRMSLINAGAQSLQRTTSGRLRAESRFMVAPRGDLMRLSLAMADPGSRASRAATNTALDLDAALGSLTGDGMVDLRWRYRDGDDSKGSLENAMGSRARETVGVAAQLHLTLDNMADVREELAVVAGELADSGLSVDQVVKDAFRKYDRNGDGVLSLGECQHFIRGLHVTVPTEFLNGIWSTLDQNGDGSLDEVEFASLMTVLYRRLGLPLGPSRVGGGASQQTSHDAVVTPRSSTPPRGSKATPAAALAALGGVGGATSSQRGRKPPSLPPLHQSPRRP